MDLDGAWLSPVAGARVDGSLELAGWVPAGVVGLLLRRGNQAAERIPIGPGVQRPFEHRLALGRGERGPTWLELWTIAADGSRRLWQRRQVVLAWRPPWAGLRLGALAIGAVTKALRAFQEGRLSPDPRAWWFLLRRHLAEAVDTANDEGRLGHARVSLTTDAERDLGDLLASAHRVPVPFSATPRVSVLIVVYNRPELVLRALGSLAGQAPHLEVIVVDNASGPRTAALLDRLDHAVIIRNPDNRGFLRAVNQAAAVARGEVLLLLNSDAELLLGSLAAGLAALGTDGTVGAVGGKLVHPDGRLQEAGAALGADGAARGATTDDPRYDFRRDCDYVSGALLLTPRRLFVDEGGFDEALAPAYYEDADYCVRLWQRGLRVVYEPDFAARHVEFASADSPAAALDAQARRRPQFLAKHARWLSARPPRRRAAGPRVLFVDDRLPYRRHGAGHPRAGALVRALDQLGCAVTVYPTLFPHDPLDPQARRAELPSTVERAVELGTDGLAAFLGERLADLDLIVVSRAHNLARVTRILASLPRRPPLLYDAEALTAARDAQLALLTGSPPPPSTAGAAELAVAADAALTLAVSDEDTAAFAAFGIKARTLGHALVPRPTPRPFEARAGLLFVGAFAGLASPNADAVRWLVTSVLPRIRAELGPIWLTVVGARTPPELLELGAIDGVELRGEVADLDPLYDEARVFVAPLRAAAGLPYKIHEAAAHGLPVVATSLLARQLGWHDELSIADDADAFAAAVVALYRDPTLWSQRRQAALDRIVSDCDPARFSAILAAALEEVGRG